MDAGIQHLDRGKNGINRPDGVTIKVDETGKLTAAVSKYEIGEFYYFRHPTLKTGFQPMQGGVIANAVTVFPEIWAYLQTTEGQKLCKTEAEWQAMSTAIWHTNADCLTVAGMVSVVCRTTRQLWGRLSPHA